MQIAARSLVRVVLVPVSYTHLDVYKRQILKARRFHCVFLLMPRLRINAPILQSGSCLLYTSRCV